MRIACLGGGPAGLYFALLAKRSDPARAVTVIERNRPEDTFGWGIVFSDRTLETLREADAETHARITASFRHWDDIDIHFRGTRITSHGHGFAGIARASLLRILQARAEALGVRILTGRSYGEPAAYADHDLVVGADGVNSRVREHSAGIFAPEATASHCRYIWLGSTRPLDAFTFVFKETSWGWFQMHAYRFDEHTATCIIETREETWRAAGLDGLSYEESIAFCERLFADFLAGHPLIGNSRQSQEFSGWQQFRQRICRRWWQGNTVLLGDAAHTAHFSIGSGTRMAMEDAVALAQSLDRAPDVPAALARYQEQREPAARRLLRVGRTRMEWFENVARHACREPEQFAYSLLTGSLRLNHDSLRRRDPGYVAAIDRWFAARCGLDDARPPMFTPLRLRALTLKNRIVVSPMATYSCRDGVPGDFLRVHLGARALGGAALVLAEMTSPCADGRITPGCAGLWNDAQQEAWAGIVAFVHRDTTAKIGIQLGHAGPKGSTRPGWDAPDEPLPEGNWPLIAASALAYGAQNQVPRAMTRADMDRVCAQFAAATRRAAQADFDWLELHCAHGYLLSSFLCPLTNARDDDYGGPLANRLRFPLEVFAAMRAAWPEARPMSVRISAHDWAPGGNTPDDAVAMALAFKAAGADLIDVSSGQTTRAAQPEYGRLYQTPFAERIRNEAGIATMAVGAILEPDDANSILAAGRADLCAVGRPHLLDPHWTLRAAAQLGFGAMDWPPPYRAAQGALRHPVAGGPQNLCQKR